MIPVLVHRAAGGDFGPLAEFAAFGRREIVASGSAGLYLSVTCAEDLPRIAPGEGERVSVGTFLGDYRLRQQRRACGIWPAMAPPPGFGKPVAAPTPALLFSGEWDPVTPPSQAEAALRELPNGRHVVIPSGGHSYDGLQGLDCVRKLLADFVEAGSAKALDTSCVGSMRRPPFPTSLPPLEPVAVAEDRLQALAGRYVGEGGGPTATIEAAGGKLKATILEQQERILLVPTSPTRFRLVGSLSTYVVFDLENGRGARLTLEEGGVAALVMKRVD
jgi:hypothetical protein